MLTRGVLEEFLVFFCKHETAYERRISDWSSDVCSSDLAAATLLFDIGKGVAAVLVGMFLMDGGGVLGGAAAFFGHCYPVWLKFKGGKGVATYMGIAMALHWPCGLIYAAVWLIALALLRYSSVGGMLAAISAPVSAAAFTRFDLVPLFLGLTLRSEEHTSELQS